MALVLRHWCEEPPVGFEGHLSRICAELRPSDAQEALDALGTSDPATVQEHFMAHARAAHAFMLAKRGGSLPCAVLGVWPTWPGVGAAQLVATDAFPEIAIGLARYVRHELIPHMLAIGLRRVEARARKEPRQNWRWMEIAGARFEGECRMLGKDGQTYLQYAWIEGEGICASRHHNSRDR